MEKNIIAIDLYKPIVLYKADTKEYLQSDKGIIVVWFSDNSKSTLDLTLGKDTTDDLTIEYCLIKGKTKAKKLFEYREVKNDK